MYRLQLSMSDMLDFEQPRQFLDMDRRKRLLTHKQGHGHISGNSANFSYDLFILSIPLFKTCIVPMILEFSL